MTRFPDIAGVVLAGGGNRRMGGVSKALCEVGGVPIIDRIIAVMRPLFGEIVIVANDPAPYRGRPGVSVTSDIHAGCGPIGGIHAGLVAITRTAAFVTACDMPFLDAPLVARVCEAARAGGFASAIPCSARGLEPLHAYYRKALTPLFERSIGDGKYRIRHAVATCRTAFVNLQGAEFAAICNVNNPWELEEADRRGRAAAPGAARIR